MRESMFDAILPLLAPRAIQSSVVVVDIDSESLARYGPWPWSRLRLANLIQKIAQAKPRVVGIDILLSEPDRLSPARLARDLGIGADGEELAKLASKLPDGDAAVADALRLAPAVLGFVLDPTGTRPPPPGVPFLAHGHAQAPDIWQSAGAIGPLPAIAAASSGFGAIALAADADGEIRRVPLLVVSSGQLSPGLAAEVSRVNYGAASYIIDAAPQRLRIGPLAVPIDADATLRILPRPAAEWAKRTVPAWEILAGKSAPSRLANRIVLIGSGAPEVGGLRETPVSPITPTIQIQADATEMLTGAVLPHRPPWVPSAEILGAVVLGLASVALALFRRPVSALVLLALLCLGWEAGTIAAFIQQRVMIDMAGPPAIAIVVFTAAAIGTYAQTEWRMRALRQRFEQHLAPDVVRMIAENPTALRLEGTSREVTAMFSDIEGFTALTDRSAADEVVQLLDGYLAIVVDSVVKHGGMVDKLIGDGVFALFNVPLDLADHARCAFAAGQAIIQATEDYRRTPLAAKLGLGRSRIGIESGIAIVGDVGGGSKLDYTALGNVVNTASRLESINKDFNTSICIGPTAAKMLDQQEIERLGTVKIRGRDAEIDVFTERMPIPKRAVSSDAQ